MVLVDLEGDRIQATVERFFAKSFRKDLVEGRSVLINTFKVVEYNSEYQTTRTPFKIVFYATTTVSVCLNFLQEVPEKYMKSFPDILSNDLDNGYLIDVVGQIVRVGHVEDVMAQGKRRSRLKIYLRDESDLQLPCTLWADYAKEVADYVKRNCVSVVVVIIRLACIENYRGEMSVSNAFNTTQILFDPVCPLVAKFRSELPQDKYILIPNEDDSSVDSKDSLDNEFLGTNIRRKLSSIHSIDTVGKYVTLATIHSVANSNSWYYIACKKCEKSFFLLLNVDDGFGGTAVFVVFDKIAQKLFKKTAEEVFEESVGDNSSGLPQSLRDLEGKEFLFKVVVTEDNVKKVKNSFSVDRFTSDDYMIQTFCSQVYSEPPFLETFVDEDRGSHVEKTLPACSKSDCDDPHVSVDVNAEDSIEKIVPASSKSDCDAPNDIVKLNTNVTLEMTAPVGSKRDCDDPDVIPTPVKTSGSRRKKNSMS
ncbi:uncharacterized protein LOC112085491 [Eutrema salsugineum]|uniref:uncharacterized protein LOC112085491 n=1 Tax=Eutrema salsugineum TaxID=72664 RepID=UPI000CED7CEE|nr:uncharacterized protein LOC112085491 [Eutrema salsugineum]